MRGAVDGSAVHAGHLQVTRSAMGGVGWEREQRLLPPRPERWTDTTSLWRHPPHHNPAPPPVLLRARCGGRACGCTPPAPWSPSGLPTVRSCCGAGCASPAGPSSGSASWPCTSPPSTISSRSASGRWVSGGPRGGGRRRGGQRAWHELSASPLVGSVAAPRGALRCAQALLPLDAVAWAARSEHAGRGSR